MERRRDAARAPHDHQPAVGIAPLAVAPPSRPGRARRYFSAAVVTGTLATLPLSSLTSSRGTVPTDLAAADVLLAPEDRPAPPASSDPATERPSAEPSEEASEPAAAPAVMADADGVELVVPSSQTALVGFHESLNPGALALAPSAPPAADHSGKPVPDVAGDDGSGTTEPSTPAVVLPTRNRAGAATSAIDIAIPEGETVVAPVTGEVVSVSPYFLYGQHPDVRIDVVPEGRPDLRIVIIHVSGVDVEAGDALVAGQTRIADTATTFPFESQIDRFTVEEHGEPTPHVHIEVTQVA